MTTIQTSKPAFLDLSHWNYVPFLTQIKADGLYGIVHKCTQGVTYVDPSYYNRQNLARSFELAFSAYHFGIDSNPEQQARFAVQSAKLKAWEWLALDWEENASSQMNTLQAERFAIEVEHLTGKLPVLYINESMFSTFGYPHKDSPLYQCPLWLAHYDVETNMHLPVGFNTWQYWQINNGEAGLDPFYHIDGHAIDLNLANMPLATLKQVWPNRDPALDKVETF